MNQKNYWLGIALIKVQYMPLISRDHVIDMLKHLMVTDNPEHILSPEEHAILLSLNQNCQVTGVQTSKKL